MKFGTPVPSHFVKVGIDKIKSFIHRKRHPKIVQVLNFWNKYSQK